MYLVQFSLNPIPEHNTEFRIQLKADPYREYSSRISFWQQSFNTSHTMNIKILVVVLFTITIFIGSSNSLPTQGRITEPLQNPSTGKVHEKRDISNNEIEKYFEMAQVEKQSEAFKATEIEASQEMEFDNEKELEAFVESLKPTETEETKTKAHEEIETSQATEPIADQEMEPEDPQKAKTEAHQEKVLDNSKKTLKPRMFPLPPHFNRIETKTKADEGAESVTHEAVETEVPQETKTEAPQEKDLDNSKHAITPFRGPFKETDTEAPQEIKTALLFLLSVLFFVIHFT